MKYTLAIFFISLAITGKAQQDTSYIVELNGLFYEVNQVSKPIGNAEAIARIFYERAETAARVFAQSVNTVWKKQDFVEKILKENTNLQNAGAPSIPTISIREYGSVTVGAWDVTLNGGEPISGTMAIAPNGGSLRLTVGATTYTILLVGDSWMRLQNYPAGSFTDLFRVSGEIEFRSIEQDVIITKN